ncbi:MAG: oligosaccharide flippase family protein, partial [Planctomycetota bacterium]
MSDRHPSDDAAPEVDSPTLGQRARRGIGVLFGRQALVQLITLGGGIALARLLSPEEFAVFAICLYIQQTFGQLSNAGLVAALIQQPTEPTDRERRVAFTMQLAALTVIAAIAVVVGPMLIDLYPSLSNEGYGSLFVVLVAALWVGAFRSVPVVLLERQMRFVPLGGIELVEVFVHQAIAVGLAFAGWGVWALAVAMLAKTIVGSVAAYLVSGWRPGLAWDTPTAVRLLSYGLPLQAKAIVLQASRGIPSIVIAPSIGVHAFGLLMWAQNVGTKLLFLFEPFRRVAFNHLCRTTQDAARSRVYGRYLGLVVTSIGVWAILVDGLGQSVLLALYGQKWAGGLGAATLIAIAATVNVAGRFANLFLDAIGRPAKSLGVIIAETGLGYGAAAILAAPLGILAGPIVWFLMSVFSTVLLSVLASRSTLYQSCRSLLTYA